MPDKTIPDLRRFTMARVSLGRTGNSLSTRDLLDFQLAHARARDAVHGRFDAQSLAAEIETAGLRAVILHSATHSREEYLRRPDLGRRLDERSRETTQQVMLHEKGPFDVIFIVADGLSPVAVQTQAVPLLRLVTDRLDAAEWRIAPVAVAVQSRVALSDEIGSMAQSSLAVMLIGERPGLSSFDSMGAYLTWLPKPGRTDADRNCISNIRPEGLAIGAAAELLLLLLREARAKRLSGVALRPEYTAAIEKSGHKIPFSI
jgi:ethanolamine ammonia-lyase small subunit